MKRNNWFFFLENDKIKKIGSTCVHEWFGLDIESILSKYEGFMVYIDSCKDSDGFESARTSDSSFSTKSVIEALATVTENFNLPWIKHDDYTLGTATQVKTMLFDAEKEAIEVDVDAIKAAVLAKWNIEASNDFEFNIINALLDNGKVTDMISIKHLGVVCWAIWKAMASVQHVATSNVTKTSEYLGSISDKITFTGTPKCVFSADGQYGVTFIYVFETEKGLVKWSTSKCLDETQVTFVGTIKELVEYNGQKQTVVTRCKQV